MLLLATSILNDPEEEPLLSCKVTLIEIWLNVPLPSNGIELLPHLHDSPLLDNTFCVFGLHFHFLLTQLFYIIFQFQVKGVNFEIEITFSFSISF